MRPFLVASLACALFASCTSSSGSSPFLDDAPLSSSAITPPEFPALLSEMRKTDFSVLFEARLQGSNGQMLWRKKGAIERFDLFVKLPHGDATGGDSIAFRRDEDAGECRWFFGKGTETELRCSAGGGLIVHVESLFVTALTDLQTDMRYLGSREIVGQTAFCYAGAFASARAHEAANICLTDHGLPLSIDSGRYLDGPASIRAVAIQPVTDEDLATLPWDVATRGVPPQHVCASELRLPPMPSVVQYLANLSPEDRQCTLPTPVPGTPVSPPHSG